MPPELIQFLLSQQLAGGGGNQQPGLFSLGASQPQVFGPPAAFQQAALGPEFPDPFTRPGFAARADSFSTPTFSDFGQSAQASDLGFLGPAPGSIPLPPPPAGFGESPAPSPLDATRASAFQTESLPQPTGGLGGGGGGGAAAGFAEGIARARLGGGGGGGQVPGTGGAASFPGTGQSLSSGLPGISGAAGGALAQTGREQQADVFQQRQLTADLLGSLIGGIGGAVGGLGGLGGGGGGGGAASPASSPLFQDRLNRASSLRAGGLGRV